MVSYSIASPCHFARGGGVVVSMYAVAVPPVRLPPFQRFIDEHADDIHRFLVALVGRNDADDAFQETFIAALRAWPRLTTTDNLRGWAFTIARNKATDVHRRRARRPTVPIDATDP